VKPSGASYPKSDVQGGQSQKNSAFVCQFRMARTIILKPSVQVWMKIREYAAEPFAQDFGASCAMAALALLMASALSFTSHIRRWMVLVRGVEPPFTRSRLSQKATADIRHSLAVFQARQINPPTRQKCRPYRL